MVTECNTTALEFHELGRRAVVGQFNGGDITSDIEANIMPKWTPSAFPKPRIIDIAPHEVRLLNGH